jgi:hypothetical protein
VSNSVGLRNLRRGGQGQLWAVESMAGYKLFVDTSVCHLTHNMVNSTNHEVPYITFWNPALQSLFRHKSSRQDPVFKQPKSVFFT